MTAAKCKTWLLLASHPSVFPLPEDNIRVHLVSDARKLFTLCQAGELILCINATSICEAKVCYWLVNIPP